MKLLVCPECKEVIPEGKWSGSNTNCHACQMREMRLDRSDLLEIDTEKAIEAMASAFNMQHLLPQQPSTASHTSPASNSSPWNNSAAGNNKPAWNYIDSEQHRNDVPVIRSLTELQMIPGVTWEDTPSWTGQKTLVIQSMGSKSMLSFGILWLAFTVPTLGFFLVSMITDPSSVTVNGHPGKSSDIWIFLLFPVIFWGVGFGILYFGITSCYSKTWIDVSSNSLTIEHGLKRRGKTKTAPRNSSTSVSMESTVRVNGTPLYTVTLYGGADIKVASGLVRDRAEELVSMLKTLLNAEI